MSVANIEMCPSLRQAYHNDSFEDNHCTESTVLTIEEIKLQLYSCFTCGVSWLQDHVCLDCAECGGYSLQRPCPHCDGQCASIWKRDLTMSHASGKARWNGDCQLHNLASTSSAPVKTQNQPQSLPPKP